MQIESERARERDSVAYEKERDRESFLGMHRKICSGFTIVIFILIKYSKIIILLNSRVDLLDLIFSSQTDSSVA
jgi:hypothetical protein